MTTPEQATGDAITEDLESTITEGLDSAFNPYYIHAGNGTPFTLVSQPLIGAENFNSWKKAILIALSRKNKEGFLTGKITKPKEAKLAVAWKCNNDLIASWIINSVSKNIAASIVYTVSVKEIWDDLGETYKESNGPRMYQLRKELVTTIQGNSSIEEYYTKMWTIWQNLCELRLESKCTCGSEKEIQAFLQTEFTMVFLMGLADSFAAVRTQILLLEPLPFINKVFSLIIQEERQRIASLSIPIFEPMVLVVSYQYKKNDDSTNRKKDRPYCTYCHRIGHTIEKCYKIHGYWWE